jgi:hypothetical protein
MMGNIVYSVEQSLVEPAYHLMELTSLATFCSIGTSPECKALVHFFLCILGTLLSLNFPENRFFGKDLPV